MNIVRRRSGASLVALSAIVAGCIAIAAPVLAHTESTTHDVKVHRFAAGSATATCPKGQHLSFGGVVGQYQPPGSGNKYVLPTGMRRTAGNELTVYGFNNSRDKEGHLTAAAFCDRGSIPTAVEAAAIGGDGSANVVATCPVGTVLVGGGFDSHSSPRHIDAIDVFERVSSREWHVASSSLTAFSPNLTAIAYCGPGPTPKLYSAKVKIAGHAGGTARARCPAGTSLVFGGVFALRTGFPYDAAHSAQVIPFSWTAASTTEWVATGYNVGSRTGTLRALAYCR